MRTTDQKQPTDLADEQQLFLRNALASVEKAERFARIKRIGISVLAFAAAIWLIALPPASPEQGVECTIIIILGLALAICTARILAVVNKNTKTVLQAIAHLQNQAER